MTKFENGSGMGIQRPEFLTNQIPLQIGENFQERWVLDMARRLGEFDLDNETRGQTVDTMTVLLEGGELNERLQAVCVGGLGNPFYIEQLKGMHKGKYVPVSNEVKKKAVETLLAIGDKVDSLTVGEQILTQLDLALKASGLDELREKILEGIINIAGKIY